MAPPYKRRRLSNSSSSTRPTPSPTNTELSNPELAPTLSHGIEHLASRIPTRPVPQRIEEIHLQIQKRSVPEQHAHHHQLLQIRQGTAISSALDSVQTVSVFEWVDQNGVTALSTINDDLGGTYATTQTQTIVSSPEAIPTSTPASSTEFSSTPSETSTGISAGDGFIGISAGTAVSSTAVISQSSTVDSDSSEPTGDASGSVDPTEGGATTNGSTVSTEPSARITAASITGSSTTNTTATATDSERSFTTSSDDSSATLDAGVFLATLANGDVVSITRSDEPYITTFANGRVSTIAPLSDTDSDRSTRRITTITSSDDSSDRSPSSTDQSTATSVNFVTGEDYTQPQPTLGSPTSAPSSTASAAGASGGGGGDDSTPPPGTIAGGVVGGCAGLAVLVLVALILLRWWKRKAQNGHHALPPGSEYSPDPDREISASMRGQPGMAERAGLRPLAGAVPAFFRHSNRSVEPPEPAERGFTRVSGRKLPSQFSPGMASMPPPSMPLQAPGARSPSAEHERNLSSTSFYRDSDGFYGGTGTAFTGHTPSPSESLDPPQARGGGGPTSEELVISPGPQRTPTVHRGGPYTMSPSSTVPSTPRMPPSPAQPSSGVYSPGGPFGDRSETPTDERSSRFTEEV